MPRPTLIIIIIFLISLITPNVVDNKINELKYKAKIQLELGNTVMAIQFYKQIIHLQEDNFEENSLEIAESSNKIAEMLLEIGEVDMARMYLDKSIQTYENTILNNQKLLSNSLNNIKKIYEIEEHDD